MAILIPALRAKFGNTEYYEAVMSARDLVQSVRPPRELDEWASFSIEERMQREPAVARIKKELAPYLVNNADRFFGSIIVLIYKGEITFEPLASLAKDVPAAYKKAAAQQIGFLTIDSGTLIVLDGQHRLLAERMAIQQEISGPESPKIGDDEICVIFVQHESNVKTRRIFNTVNRYAKPTSRGDNIITSEDDGYAIAARGLLRDDEPLHAVQVDGKKEDIVDWKSNTLSARSIKLTTISAVYETVKMVLHDKNIYLNKQERPGVEQMELHRSEAASVWGDVLKGIDAYRDALADPKSIPARRADESQTSLLFKPAAQIALFDGLLRARKESKFPLAKVIARANMIPDWSMTTPVWRDIIIKAGGTIDTSADALRRMASLLLYLLVADRLDAATKFGVWSMYNEARNPDAFKTWKSCGQVDDLEALPKAVESSSYTIKEAKEFSETHQTVLA